MNDGATTMFMMSFQNKVTPQAVGLVLSAKVDTQYRVMSDVYGTCTRVMYWDRERNAPAHAIVDPGEHLYHYVDPKLVTIDATEEVREAYRTWLVSQEFKRLKAEEASKNREITRGCTVKVVKGRKVPIGTVSKVLAVKHDGEWGPTCLLALDDEMVDVQRNGKTYRNHKNVVWNYMKNVERQDVGPLDEADLIERAVNKADREIELMDLQNTRAFRKAA